jgi:branched-chain amino acid aminotransferase
MLKPTGRHHAIAAPPPECAPVDAKAGCLYPNTRRSGCVRAASTIVCCATCWATSPNSARPISSWRKMVSLHAGGERHLSRRHQRTQVIGLLRERGATVLETTLRYSDFQSAAEIFFHWQIHQSVADYAHRRPNFAAGSVLSQRPRALLGV